MKGRVLIVDDNQDVLLSLSILLRPHVEIVRAINSPERIDEFMDDYQPDVILLDMNFSRDAVSGEEGYRWLAHILQRDPQAVVLFITAYVDTAKAVRAIKAGAIDFIPKPWDTQKLLDTVKAAVELRESRLKALPPTPPRDGREVNTDSDQSLNSNQTTPLPSRGGAGGGASMLGNCPAMQDLRQQIASVAPTDASILITGENGTGKDVVAHMLYEQSKRSNKPFVSIDLGSIAESLFEAEQFGYEKGAFTDAKTAKEGRVELANGGTLFLDEIGNLSTAMQQKLLTVLEKRETSRIGSTKVKKLNIRIISATNANLQQRVEEGTFRQDLLYRLRTIELHVPPLRERGDDIMLLAEHFKKKMERKYDKRLLTFTADARKRITTYSWPGNVRELLHTIERAVVLCREDKLRAEDLKLEETKDPSSAVETLNLAELEKQAIMRAIEISNGNFSLAAEMLGITRFKLYRKIEKMEK